jgi:hypothetical protein
MRKIFLILFLLTSFSVQAGTVTLSLSGLEDLGADARYEGWLIVNGSPVTTGVFSVNGSGVPSQTDFTVDDADIADAALFVLTIEPFPDADPAPASTHILAGEFASDMASITVDHPAALGDDFTSATGSFFLAAPSDTNALGSYKNGIWWLIPPNPDPGLVLPALPAGWVYEGWVVDTMAGIPTSTGTFTSGSGADSDAGGATAGPGGTPPFPGQDFISPLTDLSVNHAAVISVEPVPDNSPNPFTLKPLVGAISDPGAPMISQMMGNNAAATNPSGRVVLTGADMPPNPDSGVYKAIPTLGFYGLILMILSVLLVAGRQFLKPE